RAATPAPAAPRRSAPPRGSRGRPRAAPAPPDCGRGKEGARLGRGYGSRCGLGASVCCGPFLRRAAARSRWLPALVKATSQGNLSLHSKEAIPHTQVELPVHPFVLTASCAIGRHYRAEPGSALLTPSLQLLTGIDKVCSHQLFSGPSSKAPSTFPRKRGTAIS
ncbi:hypothetical protein Nmel_008293, partial [Mimus melanotis]